LCIWVKQTQRAKDIEHKVKQQEIITWVALTSCISHVATDVAVNVRGLNSESMLQTKCTHDIHMQLIPPYYSVTASSVMPCPIIQWTKKVSLVVTATMNNCGKSLRYWNPNCWISPPGKPNLCNNGYIRLKLNSGMVPSTLFHTSFYILGSLHSHNTI
jgi:hypothetical protein